MFLLSFLTIVMASPRQNKKNKRRANETLLPKNLISVSLKTELHNIFKNQILPSYSSPNYLSYANYIGLYSYFK